MKKILMVLVLAIMSVFAFSQSTKYYEVRGALIDSGWNISADQQASLVEGGSAYYYKTFYAGYQYGILAFSDDSDVQDVDIYAYYSDGTLFMKDTSIANYAILDFNCYSDTTLKIVIKNYKSNTPSYASICRFFVAYK
jgi:hypothetical protein